MLSRLTGKLLLSLLLATTVHPRIIGEHPVSEPIYTNAPGGKYPPIIASDGDGFLEVWNDYRSLNAALYAARVTASGQVLDPNGISLGIAGYSQRIVFAGGSVAAYQRTAYEPLYGGVDRVFLRGASPPGRGRATSFGMH